MRRGVICVCAVAALLGPGAAAGAAAPATLVADDFASGRSETLHAALPSAAPRFGALSVGPRRVAVILVYTDADLVFAPLPYTPAEARDVLAGAGATIGGFFGESSWGQQTIAGSLTPGGDVFGWLKVTSSNAGCDYAAWGAEAIAVAAGSGFVATSYDHVVVVWPYRACPWAGLAEVGGSRVWVNGDFDVRVVAHELGHNLGLAHAGSLACNGVTLGPSCFGSEYGDPFDVMGGSLSGVRQPSGYHKLRLGWLAPGRAVTATASGRYTIAPLEAASGIAVLRVPSGAGAQSYYVDFRQPNAGFDAYDPTDPAIAGVMVRIADDPSLTPPTNTQLLDGTPGTDGFADATFAPGTAFDDGAGARVAVVSAGPGGAVVDVTVPADTAAPSVPADLKASVTPPRTVHLSWKAASDNTGVTGYDVLRGDTLLATVAGTALAYDDLTGTSGATYTYRVRARDARGNVGPAGEVAVALPDTQAPTTPTGFKAVVLSATSVRLTWSASRDDGTLRGYYVVGAPRQLMLGPVTAATVTGLRTNAFYTFMVAAVDTSFNRSDWARIRVLVSASAAKAGAALALGAKTIHAPRGILRLPLSCARSAPRACKAAVTLRTKLAGKQIKLASKTVALARGKKTTLTARLPSGVRTALRRKGKLPVTVTLVRAGAKPSTRTLTLKP